MPSTRPASYLPASESVSGLEDGAALVGCWQGWPDVEGVCANELVLLAVHRERRDIPVSSLVRQSLVLGAMFACLSQHLRIYATRRLRTSQLVLSRQLLLSTMLPYPRQPASIVDWTQRLSRRLSMKYYPQLQVLPACEWFDRWLMLLSFLLTRFWWNGLCHDVLKLNHHLFCSSTWWW